MGPDRRRRGLPRAACAVLLGALGLAAGASPAGAGGDLCDRFEPAEVGGAIAERRVVELSGLAGSRAHPGALWGHNDSGGAAELYAVGEDGTNLGAYPLEGVDARDWEDMAAGPGPDGTGAFLYVGDIGDNDAERESLLVHRVPEPAASPAPPGAPLAAVETIELRYPTGPADAEALLIDPRTGDLVIVTKSLAGASTVLSAPAADLVDGAQVEMRVEGPRRVPDPPEPALGLPATMVTAGDVSPDGSIVLLRTYGSVLAFERGGDQSLAEALLGEPCFAPQVGEPQGEAIAFTGDGSAYVTASEGTGVPIHRFAVEAPPTTTTTGAPTEDTLPTEGTTEDEDDDDELDVAPVLVVVAVVLLVVGAGVFVLARRRRGSVAG
jgi:hypothetical protein